MSKRWTLQGRIGRWFAATAAILAIAVSGLSFVFVHAAIQRELRGLIDEELDEMHALFSVTDGSPEDFRDLVAELARRHPESPMAWRVWNTRTGEQWGEFGEVGLFKGITPDLDATRIRSYGGPLR